MDSKLILTVDLKNLYRLTMVWSLRLKGLGSGKQPLWLVESVHGKHGVYQKKNKAPNGGWWSRIDPENWSEKPY